MKTISLVIPVYNEAEHLAACLQAIEALRPAPLEVIVVDNNSTDQSVAVARSFDFVTLLSEPRQGVTNARNRGFNAARGELIGRIDADTILPVDWINKVQQIFTDDSVSAVSGAANYYDFKLQKVADAIDGFCRRYLERNLKNNLYLWGANMAMRRADWLAIQPKLCNKALIHEDFDLAIHLQQADYNVIYDETLAAGVSSRRIDSGFMSYARYTLRSPQTYAAHNLQRRGRHMYFVIAVCWLTYVPGRLIYRSYDADAGSFSLTHLLFDVSPARVDPTVNIV